jgi:hypothetical protein
MILALQYYKDKKIWSGVVLLILLTPIAIYFNDEKISLLINTILHVGIISYLFIILLEFQYNKKVINFYFIILIIYEISLLLKMLTGLINIHTGAIYYHITTIFEILICFYFIFFNIENSPQFKLIEK